MTAGSGIRAASRSANSYAVWKEDDNNAIGYSCERPFGTLCRKSGQVLYSGVETRVWFIDMNRYVPEQLIRVLTGGDGGDMPIYGTLDRANCG